MFRVDCLINNLFVVHRGVWIVVWICLVWSDVCGLLFVVFLFYYWLWCLLCPQVVFNFIFIFFIFGCCCLLFSVDFCCCLLFLVSGFGLDTTNNILTCLNVKVHFESYLWDAAKYLVADGKESILCNRIAFTICRFRHLRSCDAWKFGRRDGSVDQARDEAIIDIKPPTFDLLIWWFLAQTWSSLTNGLCLKLLSCIE